MNQDMSPSKKTSEERLDSGVLDAVKSPIELSAANFKPTDSKPSKIVDARTLKGFRDLLPREAELKGGMLQKLEAVFRSFGFPRIETPHLEYADTLISESTGETSKQIYKFADHGGRNVALRFDLTVPLARYVVQHRNEIGMPFRRFAIGNVFRGENTQAGRYREFTQCDFDIIGAKGFDASRSADAEIVQIMASSLQSLGAPNFTIRINNRKVFNGICDACGVSDRATDVLRVIDKIEKIGRDGVFEELKKVGIETSVASEILKLVSLSANGDASTTFRALQDYRASAPRLAQGIDELERIFEILSYVPQLNGHYTLDLSIARGLGYYTGVVFETVLNDLPKIGSVCSGGRYADLTSTFSKERLPGVGASVGIDRLIAALEELGLSNVASTPARALIVLEVEESVGLAHRLAAGLRNEGINVEIYPEVASAGAQFKYAERQGHRFVVRPSADGRYSLKDLKTDLLTLVDSVESLATSLAAE